MEPLQIVLTGICQFFFFCHAVLFRLSNLFIGGFFGLLWAGYCQFTGRPLPMNVFIGFAIAFFVCACFGAWREQFLEVEKGKAKRPDFQYSAEGSEVAPSYLSPNAATTQTTEVRVVMRLRFVNRGDATAYDLDGTLYGCWVEDDPPQVFVDSGQAVGKTNPGERIHRKFVASHSIDNRGKGDALTLVMLYESRSKVGSRDGELYDNEPIWLYWHPGLNNRLAWARPDDVEAAMPHIKRFKDGV